MKVLFLNYEFPPLGGGTGIASYYLLKEWQKISDLQLDVLTSSLGEYQQIAWSKNIRIVRLNIGKRNRQLHHQTSLDLIRYFIAATKFVWQHRADYDFRAVSVPSGVHTVQFTYKPKELLWGGIASVIGLGLIVWGVTRKRV